MRKLTHKVAIVTGGGRGIGRAIARGLAREGAKVLLAAQTQAEIEAVAAEIEAEGGVVTAVTTNITQAEDVQKMVKVAIDKWNKIDILVNNAGVGGPQGHIYELEMAEVMQTWEVNLLGAFLCCRAVVPHMMANGGGNIINVSSGAGQRKQRKRVRSLPYQMSKFGLEGLTNGLATQLREHKINVNSLLPGAIATRFHDSTPLEQIEALGGKLGQPESVVPAAVFLASQPPGEFTDQVVSAKDFV